MITPEEHEANREDSLLDIKRLREEIDDEAQTLNDLRNKLEDIKDSIGATKSLINEKESKLTRLESIHEIHYNEKP